MVKLTLTKKQITDLYNSSLSYEEIIETLKENTDLEISVKMVKELFDAQGFPTKKRSINKKIKNSWFEIIEEVSEVVETTFPTNDFIETEYEELA